MKRTIRARKETGFTSSGAGVVRVDVDWCTIPSEFEISWDEPGEHHCSMQTRSIKMGSDGRWFEDVNEDWRNVIYCPFCGVKL
jgi:hypothetical protein